MADTSRNPGDQAKMSKLEAELKALRGDLDAMRAEANDQAAAQRQSTERLGQEVKAERKAAQGAAARRPADVGPSTPEEARLQESRARAAEREAAARERTLKAEQESQRLLGPGAPIPQQRQIGPGRSIIAGRAFPETSYGYGAAPIAGGGPRGPFAVGPATAQTGYFNAQGGVSPVDPRLLEAYQRRMNPAFQFSPLYRQAPAGLGAEQGPAGGRAAFEEAQAAGLQRNLRLMAGFGRLAEANATSQGRFTASLYESGRALGLNAQQMERHGALTTEFIAAASRGEVTMGQLGRQIGLTIGKFAGWTAAATAVYGAVGALGAAGRGAIDAASGVGLVSRILPEAKNHADALQASFAELSHKFNLPVNDVVQAVYGMGKVFGQQGGLPAALKASEQALFAVKVGELDAATATRYLTGIVGGFKLSAEDLPAVFDAINQAQNRFGGNTGQIIAGVAKAAGQFRLVGGSYRELIALIETGARITGTTGENVGTAIGRSASSVLTPQGQARLLAAGLNPKQDYTHLLAEAARLSQGASRERVQEIARALVPAGGQFARVFVPLLQNRQLYDRVFASISPDKARGSASRELATALSQPNEELKKLLTNMEQLGVQLSRAGALDPFVGLIKGINGALHGIERLVAAFNSFTNFLGPLRHIVVTMLELAGVVRLMRRFDLGASLPGRFGDALSASPAQRLRLQTLGGLDEYKAAFVQQRRSIAGRAFSATYESQFAATEEERNLAASRALALEQERVALDVEIARIDEQRAAVARETRGAVGRDLAATQRVLEANAVPVAATGAAGGEFFRSHGALGAPGSLPPAETAAVMAALRGGAITSEEAAAKLRGETPGDAARFQEGFQGARSGAPTSALGPVSRMQRMESALKARSEESRALARAGESVGLTGRAAATSFSLAAGSLRLASVGIVGTGRAMVAFTEAAAAALGPLDVIIATAFIVPSVVSHYNDKLDALDKATRSDFGGDPEAIRRKAAEIAHRSTLQKGLDAEQKGFAKVFNFLDPFGDPAYAPGNNVDAAARELRAKADNIQREQAQGHDLRLQTIQDRLTVGLKSAGSVAERTAAIHKAIRETLNSRALTSPEAGAQARQAGLAYLEKLRNDFAVVAALGSDTDKVLSAIANATALGTYGDAVAAHLRGTPQGSRQADVRKLGKAIAEARAQIADKSQPLADELANIDKFQQAIEQYAQQQLTRGLLTARSAGAQGRVRSTYIDTLRKGLIEPLKERIARVRKLAVDQDRQVQKLESTIIDDSQQQGIAGRNTSGANEDQLKSLKAQRDRLIKARDGNKAKLRQLRDQIAIEEQAVRDAAAQARKDQFSAELSQFDAQTGLLQSQTRDPVVQARIAAQRQHIRTEKVREAYRKHEASLEELWAQIQHENEAINALADSHYQDFQSRQSLSGARFELAHVGDQQAILQHTIAQSKRALSEARKLGLGPNEIRSAQEAVVRAQIGLADYMQQQADALAQAGENLALSQTEDPIKQAKIKLQFAIGALGRAKTPADRINAQADINNARRDVRNTRQQEAYDSIEFEAQMGRLSTDAEVQRLQLLLKTIKGNRDLRRQIELRIHELKTQASSDVELNVGDIKLPSIYDVRRLAKTGTQSQLNVHQNFNIQVDGANDPAAVADNVFSKFAQHSTSGIKSAGRSQGLR